MKGPFNLKGVVPGGLRLDSTSKSDASEENRYTCKALRKKARERRVSLNRLLVDELITSSRTSTSRRYRSLKQVAGRWNEDAPNRLGPLAVMRALSDTSVCLAPERSTPTVRRRRPHPSIPAIESDCQSCRAA